MSERSELFSLPDFHLLAPGTLEEGYDPVVLEQCSNPFFAYFLWRSKESERLPGRPRLGRPKKEKPKQPIKQARQKNTKEIPITKPPKSPP